MHHKFRIVLLLTYFTISFFIVRPFRFSFLGCHFPLEARAAEVPKVLLQDFIVPPQGKDPYLNQFNGQISSFKMASRCILIAFTTSPKVVDYICFRIKVSYRAKKRRCVTIARRFDRKEVFHDCLLI